MKFVAFEERLAGLEGRHAARNPSRSLLSDLTDEELRKLQEIAARTKNVDVTDEDDAYLEHLAEKYGWPEAE